jgi:predicted nucleic acid-binding protein
VIVLDTNVVSEPVKPMPAPEVLAWLAGQNEPLAVTAVTVGELLAGIGALPPGSRRDALFEAVMVSMAPARWRLPYDEAAARQYAEVRERSRRAGRPMSVEDAMIAAICLAHDAPLATRNTADFAPLPLTVINPWATQPAPGPRSGRSR